MRPPQQERSRRTLDRILDAAMEIVSERGVEGASVQEIVDRAGSSVGSFYARFDGKDDLIRYLHERAWADATRRWDEGIAAGRWDRGDLGRVLEGLVGLLVRIEKADAGRRRALAGQSAGAAGPPTEGRAGPPGSAVAFRRHIAGDVRDLLLTHRDQIGHAEPERAVGVLLRVLIGGVRELQEVLEERQVVRELTRVAVGYLRASRRDVSPAGDDGTTVDFFDVWG